MTVREKQCAFPVTPLATSNSEKRERKNCNKSPHTMQYSGEEWLLPGRCCQFSMQCNVSALSSRCASTPNHMHASMTSAMAFHHRPPISSLPMPMMLWHSFPFRSQPGIETTKFTLAPLLGSGLPVIPPWLNARCASGTWMQDLRSRAAERVPLSYHGLLQGQHGNWPWQCLGGCVPETSPCC